MIAFLSMAYSHKDKQIVEQRIEYLLKIDAILMEKGIHTVSPLYKHFMLKHNPKLPSDWDYWGQYSLKMLKTCDMLIKITVDGDKESVGVQQELSFAKSNNIPILEIDNLEYAKQLILNN